MSAVSGGGELASIIADIRHSALVDDHEPQQIAFLLSIAIRLASISAPAPSGDDTERMDWIESQVKAYGDGYTEPREAGFAIEWRQEKPNDYWPGLRAWIDAERARGDGLDFDLPAAPTQEPPRKTSRVYETEARIEPFLKKEPTP